MPKKSPASKKKLLIEIILVTVVVLVMGYVFYRFFRYRAVGRQFLALDFKHLTSEAAQELVPPPCARPYEKCLVVCQDTRNLGNCRTCWGKIRECVSDHSGVPLPPIEDGS